MNMNKLFKLFIVGLIVYRRLNSANFIISNLHFSNACRISPSFS